MRHGAISGLIGVVLALSATVASAQDAEEAYRVDDVVVEGRRLEEVARAFVREVVLPAGDRGAARWNVGVCVGAANFQPEVAQYLVDRVSEVARELGLTAEEPPCDPSILIIGTADGAEFAREFVARRPKLFVMGGSGMDQGYSALRRFETADVPVRWWHVSVPVDDETGTIAVRLPGVAAQLTPDSALGTEESMAPVLRRNYASRLREPLRDVLLRSLIIVDVDRLNGVTLEQLADYVAFVALAQVDPEADLSQFDTILNLFTPGGSSVGLSRWDLAYLESLYSVSQKDAGRGRHASALARAVLDAYVVDQDED